MTSVGYGEEKIRCANLKGKRVASNNNIFIGNGISDKSCINYDNSPSVEFSEDEILSRESSWKKPVNTPKKGVLAKYAESVKSASLGAITD